MLTPTDITGRTWQANVALNQASDKDMAHIWFYQNWEWPVSGFEPWIFYISDPQVGILFDLWCISQWFH